MSKMFFKIILSSTSPKWFTSMITDCCCIWIDVVPSLPGKDVLAKAESALVVEFSRNLPVSGRVEPDEVDVILVDSVHRNSCEYEAAVIFSGYRICGIIG